MPKITISSLVQTLSKLKNVCQSLQPYQKSHSEIDVLVKRIQAIGTYISILQENQSRLTPECVVFESDAIANLEVSVQLNTL